MIFKVISIMMAGANRLNLIPRHSMVRQSNWKSLDQRRRRPPVLIPLGWRNDAGEIHRMPSSATSRRADPPRSPASPRALSPRRSDSAPRFRMAGWSGLADHGEGGVTALRAPSLLRVSRTIVSEMPSSLASALWPIFGLSLIASAIFCCLLVRGRSVPTLALCAATRHLVEQNFVIP